ncbi:MAG: HEAT repeat domain-containing protein [Synechococcales bacterium]|nr:HEAT repeat domain-containing protein [Synechococcales bacterium]
MALRSFSLLYATSLVGLALLTAVERSPSQATAPIPGVASTEVTATRWLSGHLMQVRPVTLPMVPQLESAPIAFLAPGSLSDPSSVLLATKVTWSSRMMDWLVPGILGTATVVGLVGAIVLMRKGAIASVPSEPLIYAPVPGNSPSSEISQRSQSAAVSDRMSPDTISIEAIAVAPPATARPASVSDPPPLKVTPLPKAASESRLDLQVTPEAVRMAEPEELTGEPVAPPPQVTVPSPAIALQQVQQKETPESSAELARLPKLSIMETLVQDLQQPDPAKRQRAIWELSQRGDTRAVQPLVSLLADSDSQQRSLILSALAEISSRTLKPMSRALALSLQDESPDVRKNAIRDLTRVYELVSQISPLLQAATEDADPEVRETAAWAIGQLNRIKTPLL